MLRGHFREAAAEAAAAAKDARRLGAVTLETGGCNTEGFARAALGDTDEGARLLREARDLAGRKGSPAGPRARRGEPLRGARPVRPHRGCRSPRCARRCRSIRDHAEPSIYDAFLELQQAHQLLRLGRTDEAAAALPDRIPGDAVGTTAMFLSDVRARLAIVRGDDAAAHARTRQAPAPGHRQPRPAVERAARADVGAARGARGPARGRARRRRARPGGVEGTDEGERRLKLCGWR